MAFGSSSSNRNRRPVIHSVSEAKAAFQRYVGAHSDTSLAFLNTFYYLSHVLLSDSSDAYVETEQLAVAKKILSMLDGELVSTLTAEERRLLSTGNLRNLYQKFKGIIDTLHLLARVTNGKDAWSSNKIKNIFLILLEDKFYYDGDNIEFYNALISNRKLRDIFRAIREANIPYHGEWIKIYKLFTEKYNDDGYFSEKLDKILSIFKVLTFSNINDTIKLHDMLTEKKYYNEEALIEAYRFLQEIGISTEGENLEIYKFFLDKHNHLNFLALFREIHRAGVPTKERGIELYRLIIKANHGAKELTELFIMMHQAGVPINNTGMALYQDIYASTTSPLNSFYARESVDIIVRLCDAGIPINETWIGYYRMAISSRSPSTADALSLLYKANIPLAGFSHTLYQAVIQASHYQQEPLANLFVKMYQAQCH